MSDADRDRIDPLSAALRAVRSVPDAGLDQIVEEIQREQRRRTAARLLGASSLTTWAISAKRRNGKRVRCLVDPAQAEAIRATLSQGNLVGYTRTACGQESHGLDAGEPTCTACRINRVTANLARIAPVKR